jgi:PKD repeat protein
VFRVLTIILLGLVWYKIEALASHDIVPHSQSYRVAIAMSSFNFNVGRLPCPLDGRLWISFNCDLNAEEIRSVSALHEYDTIVLYQFCEIGEPRYIFFRLALTQWVAEGGKLIIYDSDRCGTGKWQTPVDYSWLHTASFDAHFTVASAGQRGATGGLLQIAAENKLSMKDPNGPYFVDTQALTEGDSEAAGDANLIIPSGTSLNWCADITAVNHASQAGFAHAYTAPWTTGHGWIIYNGLDMDALLEVGYEEIEKIWIYELLHGWGGPAEWEDVMPMPAQCIAAYTATTPEPPVVIALPPLQPVLPTTPSPMPSLVAAFAYSQELFTHKPVFFMDQSADLQSTIHSWLWDFGDGETNTEQNPAHVYKTSGEYTVTLTITNSQGITAAREVTIHVNNPSPTANFEFEPFVPKIYQEIQFSDRSSDNGTITHWLWDFGDGAMADAQNPTHHYEKEGLYEVKLWVADEESVTSEPYVRILEIQRAPVVSSFTFTQKLVTHESIEFTDRSKAFLGKVIQWRWNFGDGSTADTQTASHTYNKAGDYHVSLEVSDELNTTDRLEMTLRIINPKPVVGFDFEPPAPRSSDTIQLTSQATDNGMITQWFWDLGDGSTSTEENPTHTFAKPGRYKVTLVVADDEALESDPFTRTIEIINVPPEAAFTFVPIDPLEKESIMFDASASQDTDGEVTEWAWDFGDEMACPPDCGSGSPHQPTHSYAKPGRYTVYLTVKDNTNTESASFKQLVDVGMRALAGFIADPQSLGLPPVPGWLGYYLKDGKISQDEVTDILWRLIVGAYIPGTYYQPIWSDFQALHELHQLKEFIEKYRDIEAAKAEGYVETGSYVEGVGQAFVERARLGKEINHIKPPVLLYLKDAEGRWTLAGVRFVVSTPERANRFGVTDWPTLPAAAHYEDGSTLPAKTREEAPTTNGSSPFSFWRPNLYVLTVWLDQTNSVGMFSPVYLTRNP